jgi:ABC-type transport system involved in multi-copper enzyme maturation permease subunit
MNKIIQKLRFNIFLYILCNRLQMGHRFWMIPFSVLIWPLLQACLALVGWKQGGFDPIDAQNRLMGYPLYLMSIGIGSALIAGEIEKRTLEVSFTLPGGSAKIWVNKLIAVTFLIITAELILALCASLFFTSITGGMLIRVLQGAIFYLVLAMAAGALFKNSLIASIAVSFILLANSYFIDVPWSPIFNPLILNNLETSELMQLMVQNHFIVIMAVTILALLTFLRAEQREALLRH